MHESNLTFMLIFLVQLMSTNLIWSTHIKNAHLVQSPRFYSSNFQLLPSFDTLRLNLLQLHWVSRSILNISTSRDKFTAGLPFLFHIIVQVGWPSYRTHIIVITKSVLNEFVVCYCFCYYCLLRLLLLFELVVKHWIKTREKVKLHNNNKNNNAEVNNMMASLIPQSLHVFASFKSRSRWRPARRAQMHCISAFACLECKTFFQLFFFLLYFYYYFKQYYFYFLSNPMPDLVRSICNNNNNDNNNNKNNNNVAQ